MEKTLTGPAGGTWQHCDGESRCQSCGAQVTFSWKYWVGIVAHVTLCEACVESALEGSYK
jgi:hypothetical protein